MLPHAPPALCRRDTVWQLAAVVVKPLSAGTRPAGKENPDIGELLFARPETEAEGEGR